MRLSYAFLQAYTRLPAERAESADIQQFPQRPIWFGAVPCNVPFVSYDVFDDINELTDGQVIAATNIN
jgi:hypothetical protein